MSTGFEMPDDEVLLETLGVSPQHVGDTVRRLELSSGDGAVVELFIDMIGRSVTLVVAQLGRPIIRIEREGATRMAVWGIAPEVVFSFRTDDTTGELRLFLRPAVMVEESVLIG